MFFEGELVALDGSWFLLHICGWLCNFGVVSMLLQLMFVCWVPYPDMWYLYCSLENRGSVSLVAANPRTAAYVMSGQADLLMKCLEPGGLGGANHLHRFLRALKRSSSTLYPSQRCLQNILADTNSRYVTWFCFSGDFCLALGLTKVPFGKYVSFFLGFLSKSKATGIWVAVEGYSNSLSNRLTSQTSNEHQANSSKTIIPFLQISPHHQ